MTQSIQPITADIKNQAADWLARRHSGEWERSDQMELDAWLSASRAHRDAYQRLTSMWNDIDNAKADFAKLRHDARAYRPAAPDTRMSFKFAALGLATSLLFVIGTAYWYWIGIETTYMTAKGETQEIALADGSVVNLNTDSELTVRYSHKHRRIELIRGEALFNVAHDTERPFSVKAGNGQIEDIGTRFDVYAQAKQVAVNVLEGSVQVTSRASTLPLVTLSAGQAAAYDAQGQFIADYPANVQTATAWLDGLLVFDDIPLPQVLEQLSRYHPVTFKLLDQRLDDIKISGHFRTDNLSVMLKTLETSFPILITKLDGSILVQSR